MHYTAFLILAAAIGSCHGATDAQEPQKNKVENQCAGSPSWIPCNKNT